MGGRSVQSPTLPRQVHRNDGTEAPPFKGTARMNKQSSLILPTVALLLAMLALAVTLFAWVS